VADGVSSDRQRDASRRQAGDLGTASGRILLA